MSEWQRATRKAFDWLHEAWGEFFWALARLMRVPQAVEWLADRLRR